MNFNSNRYEFIPFSGVTVTVLSTCSLLQTAIVMDDLKVRGKAVRFMEEISEEAQHW